MLASFCSQQRDQAGYFVSFGRDIDTIICALVRTTDRFSYGILSLLSLVRSSWLDGSNRGAQSTELDERLLGGIWRKALFLVNLPAAAPFLSHCPYSNQNDSVLTVRPGRAGDHPYIHP